VLTLRHVTAAGVRRVDRSELDPALRREGFLWVDLTEPTEDEGEVLRHPVLDLHPLVLEDMLVDRHLPRVEVIRDQVSLTVHGMQLDTADVELSTTELDVALADGLLVTHHRAHMPSVELVGRQLEQADGRAAVTTPGELLHLLLDVMHDVFVPFVDLIEQRLDVVEEDILTQPTEETRRDIYGLQRDVIQLRRALVPQAEAVRQLVRDPLGLLTEADVARFRDLQDHLFRMAELSESYRALLDSALASYRSALDDRQNRMLATLTILSAVLLPISVITGIFGTNFTDIPGLTSPWGFLGMCVSFVVVVAVMLAWFRSRGWIGDAEAERARARREGLGAVLDVPVLGTILSVPVATTRVAGGVVAAGSKAVARGAGTVARGVTDAAQGVSTSARRRAGSAPTEDDW
jgi:magnesium transporter